MDGYGDRILYFISEPQFELGGGNLSRLASDDCDINGIFQLLQRFGKIP